MNNVMLLPALLLSLATGTAQAQAAAPKTHFIDHSNATLISADAAKSVMGENIPAKVWKLHPAKRYAFVSQVEGGMKGSTCVVTARVMLVPLTATAKAVLLRPQKMATAFDAAQGSSTEQCQDLAREKLKEATGAVVSALVKS